MLLLLDSDFRLHRHGVDVVGDAEGGAGVPPVDAEAHHSQPHVVLRHDAAGSHRQPLRQGRRRPRQHAAGHHAHLDHLPAQRNDDTFTAVLVLSIDELMSFLVLVAQVLSTVIILALGNPIFLAVFLPIGAAYYFIQVRVAQKSMGSS